MEKEIKNEKNKKEEYMPSGKSYGSAKDYKQEPQQEREIIITIKGNNITMKKNETASVFELQAILENILRKLMIQ